MFPLNNKYIWPLVGVLILWAAACAPKRLTPQYETPPPDLKLEDNRLYYKALDAQNRGRLSEAEELWEVFLKRYPDSVEGHNNLGRVYYLNDNLSQAVQQFERGLELEPGDARLRQNLADALKLQSNLLFEDKRYDATIQKLQRLHEIAPQEQKQGIQIRMEKVEDRIYEQVRSSDTAEAYRAFIDKYPDGINAQRARQRLKEIEAQSGKTESTSGVPGVLPGKKKTPPVPPPERPVTEPGPKPESKQEELVIFEENFTDETLDETIVEEPGMESGTQPPASKKPVFNTEMFGQGEPVEVPPDSHEIAKTGPESVKKPSPEKPYGSDVTDQTLDEFLDSLDTREMEVQPEKPKSETLIFPEPGKLEPEPVEPLTRKQIPSEKTGPQTGPEDMDMIAPFEALAGEETAVPTGPGSVEPPSAGSQKQAGSMMEVAKQPPDKKTAVKKESAGDQPVAVKKQAAVKKKTAPEKPPELLEDKPQQNASAAPTRPMVRVEIDDGYLNVRSEPSVQNGRPVGKLRRGDTVPLVKETQLWFQVEYQKGKHGWISRTYARKLPRSSKSERFNMVDDPFTAAA